MCVSENFKSTVPFLPFKRPNNFKYVIAQQFKPRHMNISQQVSVIDTVFRASMRKAPKLVIYDQHVHFIGMY